MGYRTILYDLRRTLPQCVVNVFLPVIAFITSSQGYADCTYRFSIFFQHYSGESVIFNWFTQTLW